MKILLFAFPLVAITFSSCVSLESGATALKDPSTYNSLEIGKSEKKDVFNKLAQPYNVEYYAGKSNWTHKFSKAETNFGAALIPFYGLVHQDKAENTVVVTKFNKYGTLIDIDKSENTNMRNSFQRLGKLVSRINEDRTERVKKEMAKHNWEFNEKLDNKAKGIYD